jgi:hypothetical protein
MESGTTFLKPTIHINTWGDLTGKHMVFFWQRNGLNYSEYELVVYKEPGHGWPWFVSSQVVPSYIYRQDPHAGIGK